MNAQQTAIEAAAERLSRLSNGETLHAVYGKDAHSGMKAADHWTIFDAFKRQQEEDANLRARLADSFERELQLQSASRPDPAKVAAVEQARIKSILDANSHSEDGKAILYTTEQILTLLEGER